MKRRFLKNEAVKEDRKKQFFVTFRELFLFLVLISGVCFINISTDF